MKKIAFFLFSLMVVSALQAQTFNTNLDTLNFGTLRFGYEVSDTLELLVTNMGLLDLLITGVSTSPEAFIAYPDYAGIDPGESETFTVIFTPIALGEYNGTLTFTSNDPSAAEYSVVLIGNYLMASEISVNPQSIGAVLYSRGTATQSFEINNTGGSNLDFTISLGEGSYALDFDGVDDYLVIPDDESLQLTYDFTVEAWGYLRSIQYSGMDHVPIIWRGNYICCSNEYNFRIATAENGRFTIGAGCQNGGEYYWFGGTIITNQWYHFTLVSKGDSLFSYQDGELMGGVPANPPYNVSGYNTYVGWADRGNDLYTDGIIDEIRIWNIARTQDEIQEAMGHELFGNEPGLVGYWNFNEGTGLKVYDKSPSGNDGTLVNGVTWTESSAPIIPSWSGGLVGWWPFNGNANDKSGNGNDGTVNDAALTTDRFGNASSAYNFDGISDLITVQNSATLCLQNYTLSAWFKFTTDDQNNRFILSKAYGDEDDNSFGIYYENNQLTGSCGPGSKIVHPITFINENWYHVVLICDTNLDITKLYLNGKLVADGILIQNTVYDIHPLLIGAESDSSTIQKFFEGSIDDIRIYNRAISESEVRSFYHEGNWANQAMINNLLNDQDICKNRNAAFEVKALGTPPIHYKWQRDGTDITGDTNSILMIDNVQYDDTGNYRCIAYNEYGMDTSNSAKLTVEYVAPDSLILYCTFDDVKSITNPVTGLGGVFNADPETNFTTGQVGNAYIANYMEDKLVIFPKEVIPPERGCVEFWGKIFDMPEYISWGASPAFFDAFFDNPISDAEYLIMFNGNDGFGGAGLTARAGAGAANNFPGASSTGCWWYDYKYTSILGDVDAWHHYALVWDKCGVPGSQYKIQIYLDGIPIGESGPTCDTGDDRTPTSFNTFFSGAMYIIDFQFIDQGRAAIDEFKIWNYPKTQFIEQAYIYTVLDDQQICKNESVTLEVKAVGIPPLHYQWQKDGVDITGATDSVLKISSVQSGDKGEYQCIASNSYGTDTSNSAMLWIEFAEPTSILGFTYIPEYQVATYSVHIQQGHTYEFKVEGGNKIDSTGNSVTVHWGKPGKGYVKLVETSDIGCDAEDNILNVTIGSTGIKDKLIPNLNIYPNPVSDIGTFEIENSKRQEVYLEIFDFSGRLIGEKISTTEKIEFDFSNYTSGIYFYRLRNSERIIGAGKIVKE